MTWIRSWRALRLATISTPLGFAALSAFHVCQDLFHALSQ
jgi:hypothetical protein